MESVVSDQHHKRIISCGWEYHTTFHCIIPFFSQATIPHTSLSSPLPFLVSVWTPLSIWLHVRLTAALLTPFATVLFSEGNILQTVPQTAKHYNHNALTLQCVFDTWMWLLTVHWSASLTSLNDFCQMYCNNKLQSSFGCSSNNTPGQLWLTWMAVQHTHTKKLSPSCEKMTHGLWMGTLTDLVTLFPSRILFCMDKMLRMNWEEFPPKLSLFNWE